MKRGFRPLGEENSTVASRSKLEYTQMKNAARTLERYRGEDACLTDVRMCLTRSEVQEMCANSDVSPIGKEKKMEVYNRGREKLRRETQRRVVCAICDRGMSRTEGKRIKVQERTAINWSTRLKGSCDVPVALRSYYSVSQWLPAFEGALLSPGGVEFDGVGMATGAIFSCKRCLNSMRFGKRVPKFAVANGFDIGELPEAFQDVRDIEKRLCSLTSIVHVVKVLSGGRHKSLKGHVTLVRMNPMPITLELPRLLDPAHETFMVIMASSLTPPQELLAMKRHEARYELVKELLEFYVMHNEVYKKVGIRISREKIAALSKGKYNIGVVFEKEKGEQCVQQNKKSRARQSVSCPEDESPVHIAEELGNIEHAEIKDVNNTMMSDNEFKEDVAINIDSDPQTSLEALDVARNVFVVRNQGPCCLSMIRTYLLWYFRTYFLMEEGIQES